MAEALGKKNPQAMQRLSFGAQGDADAVRDELQMFVIECFGEGDEIGIVDETGFLKKGTKSVGVKRQYCGGAGKIEHCQVGVSLTYCSRHGYIFLDRAAVLAKGVVPGPGSPPRGTCTGKGDISDQVAVGDPNAGACLGAGRAAGVGGRRRDLWG